MIGITVDTELLAIFFTPVYAALGWILLTMWNCPHGCGRKIPDQGTVNAPEE